MALNRGFSLVEVMVATVVLGGLFVAALSAVAAAQAGRIVEEQHVLGHLLAHELMSEVLERDYRDAESVTLGPDPGEAGFPGRTGFDDVDDYHGLDESALAKRDGSAISAPGYSRAAAVRWADPADPSQTSATETGLKRVTVTVRWNGRPVAELVALRSFARPDPTHAFELPS